MTRKNTSPNDPCSHLESLRAEIVAFGVLGTVLGSMCLVTRLTAGFPPKDQVWIAVFSFLLHARLLVTLTTQLVRSLQLLSCEVGIGWPGRPTVKGHTDECPDDREAQSATVKQRGRAKRGAEDVHHDRGQPTRVPDGAVSDDPSEHGRDRTAPAGGANSRRCRRKPSTVAQP